MAKTDIYLRKLDPKTAKLTFTVHVTQEWKARQAVGLFLIRVVGWMAAQIMGFDLKVIGPE